MAEPTREALVQAVYDEAALVDAGRYDEWLAMFAADALYWVPLSADATDPDAGQSIACEDRLLLEVRVERIRGGRAPSFGPGVRAQHVLQAPAIVTFDGAAGHFATRTPFFYTELRGDAQSHLTGVVSHAWRFEGRFLVARKRVDLLNAHAALPPIFLFP